jgi:murein DD-endopeptidase MepM/ murein hydrolase activator NlpD
MDADQYNAAQLAAGKLTAAHVTELVRAWQEAHRLELDGMAGPGETIPSLDAAIRARTGAAGPTLPHGACWPLALLPDLRKPVITSQFRRPDRPSHPGVDIFYARRESDPPMKIGDGGRERAWWIPEGTHAIAVADGVVELASKVATGFRVWLDLGGGYHAGYFHLVSMDVAVGQRVLGGDRIGVVGDNPIDTDAKHLHFELHVGALGTYPRGLVDPEHLLAAAVYRP